MNYASEDLINEHEGILFGLRILEKMAYLLKTNEDVSVSDLKEMINFFKLFADKCHHGKEEGMLFPEMEKAGIPKENGPIGQMLIEHAEGRKHVAQMSDFLQKDFQSNSFVEAAMNYINLLRNHIEKENRILFPLGDKKIPMEKQKELIRLFGDHEENVMGKGTHEKLHKTLDEFENKYLAGE